MQEITEPLNTYLFTLRKTFYVEQEIDYNSLLEDKPHLQDSLNSADVFYPTWKKFINDLRENSKTWVRDFSVVGGRHSFNCVYAYTNLGGESSGIIISISLPFNVVGFYCYKFQNISEEETETVESYFPLDDEMVKAQQIIIQEVIKHFPDFDLFESLHSDFKVSKVLIDEKKYENVDLWQVIFTTNLFMI